MQTPKGHVLAKLWFGLRCWRLSRTSNSVLPETRQLQWWWRWRYGLHSRGAHDASPRTSVDREQVRRFAEQARDWWNPTGPAGMLQRMNPARIQFIKEAVAEALDITHAPIGDDTHPGTATRSSFRSSARSAGSGCDTHHWARLRVLDVGCGAGLLSEALAALGAHVTAIDAAAEAIAIAQQRQAAMAALSSMTSSTSGMATMRASRARCLAERLAYRCASIEELLAERGNAASFDVVTALEVLEHVQNPLVFLGNLVQMLKPGGVLVISTLDRSIASFVVAILMAERVLGLVPRGTHDWSRFIQPEELTEALLTLGRSAGTCSEVACRGSRHSMEICRVAGLVWNPLSGGFARTRWTDVNYILAARKRR